MRFSELAALAALVATALADGSTNNTSLPGIIDS